MPAKWYFNEETLKSIYHISLLQPGTVLIWSEMCCKWTLNPMKKILKASRHFHVLYLKMAHMFCHTQSTYLKWLSYRKREKIVFVEVEEFLNNPITPTYLFSSIQNNEWKSPSSYSVLKGLNLENQPNISQDIQSRMWCAAHAVGSGSRVPLTKLITLLTLWCTAIVSPLRITHLSPCTLQKQIVYSHLYLKGVSTHNYGG